MDLKTMKKITTILSLTVLMITLAACIKATPTQNNQNNNASQNENLTEDDRYINLSAEFACQTSNVTQGGDVVNIIANFPTLAQKHGFTMERAQELNVQYENDNNVKTAIFTEMDSTCPGWQERVKAFQDNQ